MRGGDVVELRARLIDYLNAELAGPEQEDEVLDTSPCQRYTAGILFPRSQPMSPLDDLSDDREQPDLDAAGIEGEADDLEGEDRQGEAPDPRSEIDDDHDETIHLTNSYLPSAVALTFMLSSDAQAFRVRAHAARYVSRASGETGRREWQRTALDLPEAIVTIDAGREIRTTEQDLLPDALALRTLVRRRSDGSTLVTVSLYNQIPGGSNRPPRAGDCFFQAGFEVDIPDRSGEFLPHQHMKPHRLDDPDEASLALLFRHNKSFARGHGCAPDWFLGTDGHVTSISTSTLPAVEVPPIKPRTGLADHLSMQELSGGGSCTESDLPKVLSTLPAEYEKWVGNVESTLAEVPTPLQERAREHLTAQRRLVERMREGIDRLAADDDCRRAFMLANRAMLEQQYHGARKRRLPDDEWVPFPEQYRSITPDETSGRVLGYWRTFQLAFILMNVTSFTGDDHERDRDLVDVIWFPTGGGKTEAYLGLAAYSIFLRRLRRPENAGTTVLMRYTLRLLTAQQFQRASSLICACERIRAESSSELGEIPITIGLWVGKSLSPNGRQDAMKALEKLERPDREAENPFQVLSCPWCGTAMNERPLGYRRLLIPGQRSKTVRLICPASGNCPFSSTKRPLPILVIDEDIYEERPTLVISTVDKLAMLAWREEAGALFGMESAASLSPPDLIIQDELHLIAGPLGSMVGLYESVIDLLCHSGDRGPKIVASTATIRGARDQCKALYNRDSFQFPPPGVDIRDSWFAKEDGETPGRIYLGVLPTASPSPVTALVRVASSLFQGVKAVPIGNAPEAVRDPYWTLVQYFGSLRELGRASSLVEADIPEYIRVIEKRQGIRREDKRWLGWPVELTSRRQADEIPSILEQLEYSYPREGDRYPLDTLLATNMISVGVDVDRLGLMLVVGQPKSTSEYIQATSRVGRSAGAPGLIVTLYNAGKPRDRSHFEQFRAYHESFYRFVEPTSVTPFSLPVVERGLRGLLVIAARQLAEVGSPDQFERDRRGVVIFLRFVRERAQAMRSAHATRVEGMLDRLVAEWERLLPADWGGFSRKPPDRRPLMYPAGKEPRPEWQGLSWAVPTSMRNVDAECRLIVVQDYPEAADTAPAEAKS